MLHAFQNLPFVPFRLLSISIYSEKINELISIYFLKVLPKNRFKNKQHSGIFMNTIKVF